MLMHREGAGAMMQIPTHEGKQEYDVLVECKHQPELHGAGAMQRLDNVRMCVCTSNICLFILCSSSVSKKS